MYHDKPEKEKNLINVIAKEVLIYEESKSASKLKRTWDVIPHWEKIRYRIEAERIISVVRSVIRRYKPKKEVK